MKAALALHELALDMAGCGTQQGDFLARKCPWRWRFTVLIGSEIGSQLARRKDFAGAAELYERLARGVDLMLAPRSGCREGSGASGAPPLPRKRGTKPVGA